MPVCPGCIVPVRPQAKAVAQPFAYEEYRKERVRKKIEAQRANRVQSKKLPKVNRQLAERLGNKEVRGRERGGTDVSNPLGDERFSALFTNPDFQVDEESEVHTYIHRVHYHSCTSIYESSEFPHFLL